jgi:uncharacterized protein YndB with AHSA1/START domain/DNA-binding transcriptional ArsR family regulator
MKRAMDEVFKALADASRRRLLDKLFKLDGQTLGELEAHLPEMTRFGVMKHLRVLEDAGLVTTQKVGREKLHYLNPVPIRRVFDRWTSKYSEPFTRALADLKRNLEGDRMSHRAPKHVFEVYIRTTPEKLWQAIVDPSFTKQYFFGQRVESSWEQGAPYVHRGPDGAVRHEGTIVEINPTERLVQTFSSACKAETKAERPSRVTWLIEKRGGACKLTLTHDDFEGETETYKGVGSGWSTVLSGLKTLLETGKPLSIGAA